MSATVTKCSSDLCRAQDRGIPEVLWPWFRAVIAFPSGAVVHHADCAIYPHRICDCGLLRAARRLMAGPQDPETWVHDFWQQMTAHDTALGDPCTKT